ncbi:hypothetical protein F4861DRAFT_518589 [Xylaria intraflava]|nr:hypothetical protein F4861DRAFT_518589 [Xylaria intraflava]
MTLPLSLAALRRSLLACYDRVAATCSVTASVTRNAKDHRRRFGVSTLPVSSTDLSRWDHGIDHLAAEQFSNIRYLSSIWYLSGLQYPSRADSEAQARHDYHFPVRTASTAARSYRY